MLGIAPQYIMVTIKSLCAAFKSIVNSDFFIHCRFEARNAEADTTLDVQVFMSETPTRH